MIIGPSGSGKSTSLRNIPSAEYGLIEVNGKALPFRSDKKFVSTDQYPQIKTLLSNMKQNIGIIDDSQYLMANEFMRRATEKGYDKFNDIGMAFWDLVRSIEKLPREKIVYFLHHSDVDQYGTVSAKSIGKMLTEKISIEGMFTIMLRAGKQDGRYYFTTQSDGLDPVKTPMEMFKDQQIDNDLWLVDKVIRDFYGLGKAEVASAKPKSLI